MPLDHSFEHRREARYVVPAHVRGDVSIKVGTGSSAIQATLRDASSTGASVLVPQAVASGQAVTLHLQADDLGIDFFATVAWCAPVPPQDVSAPMSYAVGLQLRGAGSFLAMVQGRAYRPT